MPLSDDLIKRTRKSVKNYKDKVRILKLKGVSSSAFQKVGSAKELLKAYGEDPRGLRKRLRELDEFSTKGKVYTTKGGLKLTKTVKTYKNREIRRSQKIEQALTAKAEKAGLTTASYHSTRAERLLTPIEKLDASKVRSTNYAIVSPEFQRLQDKVAVENFMKGINFGVGALDNSTFHDPNLEKRLKNRLSRLTEDELVDLMETNKTVKTLMNYYREKDKVKKGVKTDSETVYFSFGSIDELLEDLDQQLPNIIRHYRRLR